VSVYEAFAAVMADVRSIEKSERNAQQGFTFRGIDSVMQIVGPALRQHGVFIVPTAEDITAEKYVTKSGTQMENVTVKMRYTVYGPGGDCFVGGSYGQSADAGDKAVTKAQSVAYRTFLLQSLTVPTGDPDPDASTHERGAPEDPALVEANEARGEMLADLQPHGWTPEKLLKRFKADHGTDLLAADTATVKAFWKVLSAEAKADPEVEVPS
jgi:hypothetical protein